LHLLKCLSHILGNSSFFTSRKVFSSFSSAGKREKEGEGDGEEDAPNFLTDLAYVPGDTPHFLQETPHNPQGTPHEPRAGGHVPQDLD
jgi:hypothetical protein